MGLDATVMCRCFKLGSFTAPPFPREWLELDEAGYVSLRREFDTQENWIPFDEWIQTCCQHPGMDYSSEHISNWTGYRLFQEALERVGWEHFPTLARELPNANGGLTSSSAAKDALAELDYFRRLPTLGKSATLVDTKTGFVIFNYVAAYEGIFILGGRSGVDVGIGEFEFFVRDRNTRADLFRAVRVRQTLLDTIDENRIYNGRVQFEDLDSGKVYVGTVAVSGREIPWPDGRMQNDKHQTKREHPAEFHVEIRDVGPVHFDYIVGALSRVFQASVTTGNPVRWC